VFTFLLNSRLHFHRRVELERKLAADTSLSDERKQRQLQALGRKESTFLRLRRTRLGLDDFRTVKVIGKGAFGAVGSMASVPSSILTVSTGPFGAEAGHGQDICPQITGQGRNVETRSGEPLSNNNGTWV
jgi:hypothetical protein